MISVLSCLALAVSGVSALSSSGLITLGTAMTQGTQMHPSTRFCGHGHPTDKTGRDLAPLNPTDLCCWRRDQCQSTDMIMDQVRVRHCDCDYQMVQCLMKANSPLALEVIDIFYNAMGAKCLNYDMKVFNAQQLLRKFGKIAPPPLILFQPYQRATADGTADEILNFSNFVFPNPRLPLAPVYSRPKNPIPQPVSPIDPVSKTGFYESKCYLFLYSKPKQEGDFTVVTTTKPVLPFVPQSVSVPQGCRAKLFNGAMFDESRGTYPFEAGLYDMPAGATVASASVSLIGQ
eukprot:comp14635_c0_seq1/m.10955 comp14635_c0_seq1/g.10955  ORF comp14635_c0_seq1/g.10955 comp14635_c0_seq1/m.10955 type:complete len:289 (-) comp14635_c0_seq1:493-1359(-)